MNNINFQSEKSPQFKGFIKIWRTEVKTGLTELVIDKPNTVLYQGADLLAFALAGEANAKISHFYIGFKNSVSSPGGPLPAVDKSNSAPMTAYADPYGYLRLPLTFPVSYFNDTNYVNNIPVFTVMITTATTAGGAAFTDASPASWIFEVASVAALNPTDASNDKIFSRVQFTPIQYDSNFNLTISWGVQFVAV